MGMGMGVVFFTTPLATHGGAILIVKSVSQSLLIVKPEVK